MRRSCVAHFLAALIIAAGAASPAFAQDYSDEQERLCTGDAFRLCGSEIPNVDRVTACMIRRKNELSPGCRAVFTGPAAGTRAPIARGKPRKPSSIFQDDD